VINADSVLTDTKNGYVPVVRANWLRSYRQSAAERAIVTP